MKIINQQIIKNSNLKKVYNYVYDYPGISRARIAKLTGLSKTTISSLVEELINNHIIYDKGTDTTAKLNVGRTPSCLMPTKGYNYVAVALWELNYVCMHLVDINNDAMFKLRKKVDSGEQYIYETRKCLDEMLEKVDKKQILGVCIIVPGMIDPKADEIISTPIGILEPTGKDVVRLLKKNFTEFPLCILNDTTCLTYAEMTSSKIKDIDFAFINYDKGIGAALYIQKQILGGGTGTYTQFGHYSIDPEGKACSCGGKGCLEVMIVEKSIIDRVNKLADTDNSDEVNTLKMKDYISYRELGKAVTDGNQAAIKIMRDIAFDFSKAITNLICIVCPKLIIIGGTGKNLGDFFLETVKENLKNMGFRYMVDPIKVMYSKSEVEDCYKGATRFFIDEHYDFTQSTNGSIYFG